MQWDCEKAGATIFWILSSIFRVGWWGCADSDVVCPRKLSYTLYMQENISLLELYTPKLVDSPLWLS